MFTTKGLLDILRGGECYVLIDAGPRGLHLVDSACEGVYDVKALLPGKREDVPDGRTRCIILSSTKLLEE